MPSAGAPEVVAPTYAPSQPWGPVTTGVATRLFATQWGECADDRGWMRQVPPLAAEELLAAAA